MLYILSVIQEPCYSAVTAFFLGSFLRPHTLATLQGERTICNFPHAVLLLILLSLLVLFLSNLPTCLQVIINGHYNIIKAHPAFPLQPPQRCQPSSSCAHALCCPASCSNLCPSKGPPTCNHFSQILDLGNRDTVFPSPHPSCHCT